MPANDDAANQNEVFNQEKASPLKTAFQWAGAFTACLNGDAPQNGYTQCGFAWDYYKAKLGARHAPKG